MQTSHFATNFPIVGVAALPPAPNALGGDIFVIGSPKHHLFDDALKTESEGTVPVSLLRLKPFYYVFNKTIAGPDKVYTSDDPRLKTGTRYNKDGTPDRKRWWEAANVWTGVDFGAGPGSIAVRETKTNVIVLGVGGGTSNRSVFLMIRKERGTLVVFGRIRETRCGCCFCYSPLTLYFGYNLLRDCFGVLIYQSCKAI
jgi:hypothetical protein